VGAEARLLENLVVGFFGGLSGGVVVEPEAYFKSPEEFGRFFLEHCHAAQAHGGHALLYQRDAVKGPFGEVQDLSGLYFR